MKDQVLQSKESHAEYNNKSYWKGAFDAAHPDTARHYAMLKHGLALVNTMKQGTIIDATLIAAPSSTVNKEGKPDPDMHQTQKGNQWYF
jgi:hypothetical protein